MSFAVPKNVPSFSNTQRVVEDHLWQAARGGARARGTGELGGGLLVDVQDKVGNFLNPNRNALPMYKDKPYAHSRTARPLYRRKGVLGLLFLAAVGLVWWTGFFERHQETARASLSDWGWLREDPKTKGDVDWLNRRERVVEAFQLSWDAYERYAWGELGDASSVNGRTS